MDNTAPLPKVLISGASGLVGTSLCQALSANNYQLARLTRNNSSKSSEQFYKSVTWDPATGAKDLAELEGFDAIIHLAGRSIGERRWSSDEKQKIRDSRVQATEKLASQVCKLDKPPALFVSASAIGIYGDRGPSIVDENTAAADDFLARVARDWEDACLPLKDRGVRVVHPRLGIVLAEQGGALAKMLPLFKWMLGGRLGDGAQYWSWVDLQDCVRAIQWMVEKPDACGAYNVVAPNPVTNAEFTKQLADVLGRSACLPAPKFGLRLALGEMADALLLASCRVVPSRLLQAGFDFRFADLRASLENQLLAR